MEYPTIAMPPKHRLLQLLAARVSEAAGRGPAIEHSPDGSDDVGNASHVAIASDNEPASGAMGRSDPAVTPSSNQSPQRTGKVIPSLDSWHSQEASFLDGETKVGCPLAAPLWH